MQEYILRRLIQGIPILIGISFVCFLIIMLAPGDPIATMYPDYVLQTIDQEAVRQQLGLDKPLPIQYLNMMKKLVTGDLDSFKERRPVFEMIMEHLPTTLFIAIFSLILSLVLAIPIAMFAALSRSRLLDGIIEVGTLIGISMPSFLIGLLAILLFSEKLGWLPSGGIRPIGSDSMKLSVIAPHLVMPVMIMSFLSLPALMRYARAGMIEAMREDYIRTARSKGMKENLVIFRHALKNALLPVISEIGLNIPWLIGGTAIVETIFALPGMGRLAVDASVGRDYPVILTINLFIAAITILSGILTDITYSIFDPRIRQG